MSKDLQAIKYLNDTCINFLDRTKELYCTVTFTRKRAEILRDNIAEVEQALHRLESIDNANPSEALECLELIGGAYLLWGAETVAEGFKEEISTIKQALLKAQEPKQYLKWEDLEFTDKIKTLWVKLGGNAYKMQYYKWFELKNKVVIFSDQFIEIYEKKFFNDLHLERVEE